MLPLVWFVILKGILIRGSSFVLVLHFVLLFIVTMIGRVSPSFVILLLDILCLWVAFLILRRLRSSILFLGLLAKQNIALWPSLYVSSSGSINFFVIFRFPFPGLYLFTTIVKLLFILLLISFFMNAQTTSRFIATSSVMHSSLVSSLHAIFVV